MKYVFIPSVFEGAERIRFAGLQYDTRVVGEVIHVNREHRHFTVRGICPRTGAVITESFKY